MQSLTLVSFAPVALDTDLYHPRPSTSGERVERRMAVVVCAVLLVAAALAALLS